MFSTFGDLGKLAYGAFSEYLIDNKYELGIAEKLPPAWDKLSPRVQQAWERAAETLFRAVRKSVEQEYQIRQNLEMGKVADAQQIILDELKRGTDDR